MSFNPKQRVYLKTVTLLRRKNMNMNTRNLFVVIGLAMCLVIGSMSLAVAQTTPSKALSVRPAGQGGFDIAFEPVKESFNVGEAIKFKIKGNERFFLYLFSIDKARDQGVLVLPHSLHKGNMYEANREYVVPGPGIEFFSAQPGTEKLIMVASTKWLELDAGKFTKSGDFYSTDAGRAEYEAKALEVRSSESGKNAVTKEIALKIEGPVAEAVPPAPVAVVDTQKATPFVATDKNLYLLGDHMKIVYGADREGFVYLFYVEPDGKPVLLKKQPVNGKDIYNVQAKASEPAGNHILFALFDAKGDLNTNAVNLDMQAASGPQVVVMDVSAGGSPKTGDKDKGIQLLEPETPPFALYQINIQQ
jgi:hypothetical protein